MTNEFLFKNKRVNNNSKIADDSVVITRKEEKSRFRIRARFKDAPPSFHPQFSALMRSHRS